MQRDILRKTREIEQLVRKNKTLESVVAELESSAAKVEPESHEDAIKKDDMMLDLVRIYIIYLMYTAVVVVRLNANVG